MHQKHSTVAPSELELSFNGSLSQIRNPAVEDEGKDMLKFDERE